MGSFLQFREEDSEPVVTGDSEVPVGVPAPAREKPLELLRDSTRQRLLDEDRESMARERKAALAAPAPARERPLELLRDAGKQPLREGENEPVAATGPQAAPAVPAAEPEGPLEMLLDSRTHFREEDSVPVAAAGPQAARAVPTGEQEGPLEMLLDSMKQQFREGDNEPVAAEREGPLEVLLDSKKQRFREGDSESVAAPGPQAALAVPAPEREGPLEMLLRDAMKQQFREGDREPVAAAGPQAALAAPAPGRERPLELLPAARKQQRREEHREPVAGAGPLPAPAGPAPADEGPLGLLLNATKQQFREAGSEPVALAGAALDGPREGPLALLRDAITQLRSSDVDAVDQTLVANLLAAAREALEHTNVVAGALAHYDENLNEGRFESVFEALDAGLRVYPADPLLLARRLNAEERQRAFETAAAVTAALKETDWLLEQDRTDLAVQFLLVKSAEVPDQPELISRLNELEKQLPEWEQKREVQAAIERAAGLGQLQQWQAAVTILEEALEAHPVSVELMAAARRAKEDLLEYERKKKLARRLDLIRQKIAAQSWKQAIALLEDTQAEFSGAPELDPLRHEADAGLRRSECEAVLSEARQYLADGELDLAEQALRKGRKTFGRESALEVLRDDLVAARKYREELRMAQILFGRLQLQEAEDILLQIAAPDHPEAQVLLDAVRSASSTSKEETLWGFGREKALELMHQGKFADAASLLRNLTSLFPDNRILERDLAAAQRGLDQAKAEALAATGTTAFVDGGNNEPTLAPIPIPAEHSQGPGKGAAAAGRVLASPAWRSRRIAIVAAASLLLVSVTATVWKIRRGRVPDAAPAATKTAIAAPPAAATRPPTETPAPVTQQSDTAAVTPIGQESSPPAPKSFRNGDGASDTSKKQRAASLRQFVPPSREQASAQVPSSALPPPPEIERVISARSVPGLPANLARPAAAPAPPTTASSLTSAPTTPPGGKFQEAIQIARPMPAYPPMARLRALYGEVRLEATIDEHGNVAKVKVLSGDPVLALAAKNAVLQWKYRPATLNGQPIASNAGIRIVFGDPSK